MKLFIIGNGFDRHHRMKTSYYDFAEYLRENDYELYDILESYFYYSLSDTDFWWRFEENLANFDIDQILEDYRDYLPDIASDEFRDRDLHMFPDIMQNTLEKLTSGLISNFTNFIRSVEIPKSAVQRKLNIDKDALFFTFNYTYTLEDLYKVSSKNILHIHNAAESRYSDIILGHGMDPDSFKEEEPTPPDGLSEQELEEWYESLGDNWDYSYDTGKENIIQYFAATYKNTRAIISENEAFFKKLSVVDEVFVFGHSLADVDIPYFKEIIKIVNSNSKWTVSYYSDTEEESHKKTLLELGINESNIELIQLEQIQIDTKQLKISF